MKQKQRIFFLILLLIGIATLGFAQSRATLISEGFESGIPAGWVSSGWIADGTYHNNGAQSALASVSGSTLMTPLLANPGTLTYYHRGNTSTRFRIEYASSTSGPWTALVGYPVFANAAWGSKTDDLSAHPNCYFRWTTVDAGEVAIDDISIETSSTPTPVISLTGSLVDFGAMKLGNTSTEQSYHVSATNLIANLILTAHLGFQISTTTGAGFASSITLTPLAGTVSSTEIFVRFSPSIIGVTSGNISHTSSTAVTQSQPVSGTGINTPLIITPAYSSVFTTSASLGGNITDLNSSDVTERGIYYSTTSGFADGEGTKVSETGIFNVTGIFTVSVTGLSGGTTYYFKAFAKNAAGTSYTNQNTFSTPGMNITGSLANFGFVKLGSFSTEQHYIVAGTNLTANLVVTAPTDYEVSLTPGAGFGHSVTIIPVSGTVGATTIYVRFAPGTAVGVVNGNITHVSGAADMLNLPVSGTAIDNPVITTPQYSVTNSTTAMMGATISNINSSNVTERGIYFSTTNGFAIPGTATKASETGSYGTGDFVLTVTGLTKGTTYYFKGFATNAAGTSYTVQHTFGTPGITVTGSLGSFGAVKVGNVSTPQSFVVSGVNLTDDLVITCPPGFETSLTSSRLPSSGFGTGDIHFAPSSGTVTPKTIYVRFKPTVIGSASGNVGCQSNITTTVNVAVSGTGIDNPVITDPTSTALTGISAVLGGNITNVNSSNVTERGVYYSTTDGFAIPGTAIKVSETGAFGTGLFTLNVPGLSQAVTYYFKAFATNAAGTSYTTQASFLTPAVFTPASIVVTQSNPATGTVVIGTVLTVRVTDTLNQTLSQFQTVTCDFTQFGGPSSVPMVKTTNLPGNGIWTVAYTVLPGDLEVFNSKVSVTVSNYATVQDDVEFVVNNYLDVPDILTASLMVNNDPLDTTFKIGDTIHLKLTVKSYVDSVWVNWGSAFTGAPTLAYKVIAGAVDAAFVPVAGQLNYTPNLTILVSKMKSTNGFYTYQVRLPLSRMIPFSKSVSLTAAPLSAPIIADLSDPDIDNTVDLFYDTDKPLRFSPVVTPVDGYTTLPNTFAIRFYVPAWGALGEASKITIKFESEGRSTFYRTFGGADVTTIEEEPADRHLPTYQQIIWDGKDNLGNMVSTGVSTTYGLTIWAIEDAVGNAADLTHILGPEYSPTGVHDDATHFTVVDGITILNRIHVVVDNLLPSYTSNLNFRAASITPTHDDRHLIRYINDANYNGAYDAGESVQYTDITNPSAPNGNNVVDLYFRVRREYTVDSNPLRHESVNNWVVLEQTGSANKWYFDGANWASLVGFDQYTDANAVTFPTAATNSDYMYVSWDNSNLVTFPGSIAGITYKLYDYIQDNAGNITKSQEQNVIIENRYIQLPVITAIALTSQHIPGPGGVLPAETGGVNNYYLTAAYGPADAPYTGNYYVSPDIMNVEFTINNPDLLRATNSVLVDFPDGFGVADFYINKADFGAVTHKYTKSLTVANIPASNGSAPGTLWTLSENPVAAGNIQVKTWSNVVIGSSNIEGEVNDTESFNLLIPAKPVFPTTIVGDYHLTATPAVLSPGNPLFTYDAATNPANDNLIDESNFNFTIPLSTTNIHWTLTLETQDAVPAVFKTWSGNLTPAETPWTPAIPFNFNGLKDDFTLGVPIESTQLLNLKLVVLPQGYADPGYLAPPSEITPLTVVKVDNTNPAIVSGASSTVNPVTGAIALVPASTPIVTETENQMTFTLYTSEPLSATIAADPSPIPGVGWQVEVRDSLGHILMNGADRVTATINTILPGNGSVAAGYQTFGFTVTVNNITGDFTNLKPVLIVKSPWDVASNPGRYNNPVYPYNADVFHNDSDEAYLTFNILNAKPRITQIDFTHRSVVGTAKYSGSTWNPQFVQGWVNSGAPNTFTLTATVTGGVYRALVSNFTADLSAFMGPAFTAVAPDQVTSPVVAPNEARIWTLTWTNKVINSTLATAWTDNQVLNIPISIVTQDSPQPAVHSELRDINIKVDKVNPTISSTQSNIQATGAAQNLVFSIADPTPGSGINWTTASLSLNPNTGITIGAVTNGTWPVTIPANSAIKYFDATCTVSDYMGNSFTYHQYVNVIPIPAISAVTLTTVNPGEVSNNYFVPGRNLTAAFIVANPQRVKRLVVTLTASGGVAILNNVQTITTGIIGSMSVAFNGVTSTNPTDLDGKVITATITGVTDAYIAPTASAIQEINLTGNGSTATINVDTKPVITSTTFYYNNQVTNTLLRNMNNVKIVAVVSNVSALNTTTNPMTITMQNVTGTFTPLAPVVTLGSGITTYTWNNVSFANLNWAPASDYKVAAFKFNCRTVYGYPAAERSHEMVVMSDRTNQIYGVVQNDRTPYAGVDPDGWFAPEHTLKTEYTFISNLNQPIAPIRANFDQIEDNLQDNWLDPATTTVTPLTIVLQQGGVPVSITIYKYLAKWSVQPDVQSVWNAYDDGASAPIYFKYRQYPVIIVADEIDDTRSIRVDKKVPIYDNAQLWVAVKATTPASGDYQFVNNGFNRPSTLALQTNGSWVTGNNIYVKYRAKDSTTGIGVGEIYNPANPAGWTITNISQTDVGSGVVEKVIQLTPANPAAISSSTTLSMMLGKVEDKVGHVNYGLPVNSTDINWTQFGPILNFNFSANYITNIQSLEAFQVFGGNYTDNKSKPYVKAGQPLGAILKLAPIARGVDVQNITVSNVKINTKWITSVGGTGADNFVTLAYNAGGDFYYLNSSYLVNSAYTHGAGITLQYQINYTINYTDATTSSQQFTSEAIPNVAIVENNSPVLRDVFVWSGSLGAPQEGYVVPNDPDGTIKVIFNEQAGYINPNTKPSVTMTNLNVFVAGLPASYNVPATAITYYENYSLTIRGIVKNYTNVWVADLVNLAIITPNPVTTSTEIGYTITDVVGNPSITGDRFVEIAANGPIVPIIRYVELLTTLPEGQIVSNYMAQTVPAQLKIYSDVQEIAYIEDAWATPIAGITFGTFTVAPTALHNSKYVITIPVNPININNISPTDSIMITVNTKRNPFSGPVFYDAETIGVRVDGEMFNLINPAIIANSIYGNITGMINPAVQTTVTAQVNDIGELIRDRGLATLPSNEIMASWFTLQNNVPVTFTTIPTPVVTGTGNGRTITWVIPSANIDPSILTATGPMSVKIQYRNIYGLIKTYNDINFNVDKTPPVFAANGIRFYDTHTATPTMLQQNNYTNPGWITNSYDWDKVRFVFEDPIIRTDVNGAGVHSATVTMTRENETYPTSALSNLNPVIVDANTIELSFINGFSANELAEGYYNFNITVVDNIENSVNYTQRFWYGYAPAELVIQPSNNYNLNVSAAHQQVSVITGDSQGQIVGVDFHLYFDANNNGTYQEGIDPDYTADITSDDGNPDMVVPFDVMWNLTNRAHYCFLPDPVYGNNPTRKFLLRASIISQNRSVTDTIVVINVTDDQPAVPEIPWYTGNTTFDYLNTANNVLTLTTRFIDWPDARRVRFEITKEDDSSIIDTLGTELAEATDNASVQWNFSNRTPGKYLVKAYGRDFVGNWSSAVSMTALITIYDPASIVTYEMKMWNVQGYNIPEVIIPSGTKYGTNNPASLIGDLRLDVRFDSLLVHSQSTYNYLSGVSAITFKAVVRNNITGTETIVDVPNNTTLQPDYPAIGSIPVTPQVLNRDVRIFVPDSFFMPAGYDSNDYTYKFFVELTPTHPAVLYYDTHPIPYQNLQIDYFAPRVVITSNTPYITWSKPNQFVLQDEVNDVLMNDVSDINNITLMWSMDNGTTWHNAVASQVNGSDYIRFDNWVTRGGSVNTLLYNYEGSVSLKVRAYDALGNMRESDVVRSYVDNKAPVVPIAQVAYSTVYHDQQGQDQIEFVPLHTLGTPQNPNVVENGNTITAAASSGSFGTSILQLRTNQNSITGLSNVAIGPNYTEWYTNPSASWYTRNDDLRPPVILYHGFSATGDSTHIQWTPGELFDHEADVNGNYGFDVDFIAWGARYSMPISGTHYFIFAAKDSRGNMEGDFADTLGTYYDGILSNLEKDNAIDLRVNVIDVADVTSEIVSHTDNQIVSEWLNLAADVDGEAFNVNVDQVRFERKQGNTWLPINTVDRADDQEARSVMFHLYRSDVPQFDGLPFVPGVHLYANGQFIRELTWNQSDLAWADTVSFVQGHYNFEYKMDLNNDGIIDGNDGNFGVSNIVADPNGFTQFNVTPWITYLDTRTIPIGLYEFRALPLNADGNVLFNKLAPSRWLVIDNAAPATTFDVVGGITRIKPNVSFGLVADVNELLVAQDDLVNVTYQYASQPQLTVWLNNTSFRHWNDISTSSNMTGNYFKTWAAPSTDDDMVDNDADGLIDEIDEQDAIYYLRAIAKDKAGNYFTSNIYEIEVDGSAPTMMVNDLTQNGVSLVLNGVLEIPATGNITINALNSTPDSFDNPVTTRFQMMYKASQNDTWGSWQFIDGWSPVTNGTASVTLIRPFNGYLEGYYGFKTVSKDSLGNVDESPIVTYVIFDDVISSNIHITRVGSINVVSDAYGFAQSINAYNGLISAHLDNPLNINTVTFEYAMNENGPWTNINTIPINGQPNVLTQWNNPNDTRVPYIYLRATAQDFNANNQNSKTVKLYIDNTAPGIVINSLTHTVINNKKVIDPSDSVLVNISYTGLPDDGVFDVSRIGLRLVGPDDNEIAIIENYVNVGQANVDFVITEQQLAGVADGIYSLQVRLFDFAGNHTDLFNPIIPDGYDALYIDRSAPANLSIYSVSHPNNQAPYNSSITFRVNYTDLIGIPAADAMTAVFTYMDATDTVNTYTVNETNGYLEFVWDPSSSFEQYLIDGLENIVVSANITVEDFLNHEATVPSTVNFFTLTYGIPTNVRMMAISDVVKNNSVTHFVNWNLANPQVVEQLGTNHTPGAEPAPLTLYAYVPHQAEIPTNMAFSYRKQGTTAWNIIGNMTQGDEWNFVDVSFNNMFQRQYAIDWDIVNLVGGVYEVKTVSTYLAGESESTILVNIYNSNLIPKPFEIVNNMPYGNVERGNSYLISVASYTGTASYVDMVRYQYRYINNTGNVITPLSQWMYFGEQDGTEMSGWISTPYNYNWKVYPYYLYNNDVQIVGYAKDKWGTETPINSIIQSNSYVLAHITDTLAPEIQDITINWNGIQNPEWLSGIINQNATVKAHIVSNVTPNDITRVEFYYNNVLIHTEAGYPDNNQVTNFWTQTYNFNVPSSGNAVDTMQVWTYDIYNNIAKMSKTLKIDNTMPVANLMLTLNGVPITDLERETEITLNANATDITSGVHQVAYSYRMVGDNEWMPISTVGSSPFTTTWVVPADLEFGAHYEFIAVVTDNVGHVLNAMTEEPFEVIDQNTQITIVSVAGHNPVNHIIPFRLHGNFNVVTNVTEGQNIPRLEFLIRSTTSSDWRIIEAPFLTNPVYDYSANFNLNSLPSGEYYLGVAPHGRWVADPVDFVKVTLDNDINLTGINSIPTSEGFFNGSKFVVNFTVANDDEINLSQVNLQYAYPIDPDNWYSFDVAPVLVTYDGHTYQATFNNISIHHGENILDGYYNFRINVVDYALPTSNEYNAIVATHVLYDTGNPNVIFSSINGVTDMALPINIELGSNTIVNAAAFDIFGGQIHQFASGVQNVEFYSQMGSGPRTLIADDTTEPYGIIWNTLGYQLGDYTLVAVAHDRAGNQAEYSKLISIVAPVSLQPYAVITALNFNVNTANQDNIYAVTKTWAGVTVTDVAFEYYNGTSWLEFAQANQIGGYWKSFIQC